MTDFYINFMIRGDHGDYGLTKKQITINYEMTSQSLEQT